MEVDRVVDKIKNINRCLASEFSCEITSAFDGYNVGGETRVIVDKQDDLDYGNTKTFSAFVNHEYSPIVRIEIEKNRGKSEDEIYYNVKDAYIMPE